MLPVFIMLWDDTYYIPILGFASLVGRKLAWMRYHYAQASLEWNANQHRFQEGVQQNYASEYEE